uniref:Uncharacterized protein n=1 Tax=Sphenodon punctatus TaxID=8508 RepID=A0A8D0HHC9_SPHPU
VSMTRIEIWAVPDLGGLPPSMAVSTSCWRVFSSTSSGYLLPSPRICISTWKYSLGLSV